MKSAPPVYRTIQVISCNCIEKKSPSMKSRECTLKVRVKNLTFKVFFYGKYSEEFKMSLVNEYLDSSLGYELLAKKYGMSSYSQIVRWVVAYQAFGREGLQKKQKKQVYLTRMQRLNSG